MAVQEALKEQYSIKDVRHQEDFGKVSLADVKAAFAKVLCYISLKVPFD